MSFPRVIYNDLLQAAKRREELRQLAELLKEAEQAKEHDDERKQLDQPH
jgi:hypothetical protein